LRIPSTIAMAGVLALATTAGVVTSARATDPAGTPPPSESHAHTHSAREHSEGEYVQPESPPLPAGPQALPVPAMQTLAVSAPPTPSFGAAIDPYAAYVAQSTCQLSAKPGVTGFAQLILRAYPGTRNLGTGRACNVGGKSEHKEARAWDWGVRANNAAELAKANSMLNWLLATDRHGNRHALARRLGVMYIIWNRKMWRAYQPSNGWQSYSGPNPHIDHVHISFSWAGARKQTTWWQR
jgi:hypothetical protein